MLQKRERQAPQTTGKKRGCFGDEKARFALMLPPRHAELDSASQNETLKRVQGDVTPRHAELDSASQDETLKRREKDETLK
jgi:hypothetical protein